MVKRSSTPTPDGKVCSIDGRWYPYSEFEYGNRPNRSYCKKCNREEKAAYRQGGTRAARRYREEMRSNWKKDNNQVNKDASR